MNESNTLYDRPQTPDENNCCGNGCNPCIFDIHKELLEKWKKKIKEPTVGKKNVLETLLYKSFYVEKVEDINSDYVIIYLKYNDELKSDAKIFLNAGQHVIINILSWSKPFTPIAWTDNTLELLIRIYPTGINTNKLKNIGLNTEIRVRGPYGDYQYIRNTFTSIIMFSMGSGIAALYPIAKSIVNDEVDETRVYFNIGFKSVDHVPLIKELKLLADFWNVTCTLHLTQQDNMRSISGIDIKYGRIEEQIFDLTIQKCSLEKTLILICGNNEFNDSLETWSRKYHCMNYHVFK